MLEILQQMLVLFFLMGIGFIAFKCNIITSETKGRLSSIVVNIANPALILTSVTGGSINIKKMEFLYTLEISLIIFFILILLAAIIPRFIGIEKQIRGVYSAMLIFSNISFMGFPIISEVYGSEALLYASVFLLPYNILIYTYGIKLMNKKDENREEKKQDIQWRRILNNGVIACIISIFIFLTNLQLPYVVNKTMDLLGNLTAPLSMMVIGASLVMIRIREIITDYKLLIFVGIKQFVIPILLSLAIFTVVPNKLLCGVCMIMLSTPVGSMTSMLAEEYNGDFELASKGVAITTLVSVISLPIVSYIVQIL